MQSIRKAESINFISSFRKAIGEFENLSQSKKTDLEEEKKRAMELQKKYEGFAETG